MAFQGGPEGEGRGKVAEEEVGDGEGEDEGDPRVEPQLGRAQDDDEH